MDYTININKIIDYNKNLPQEILDMPINRLNIAFNSKHVLISDLHIGIVKELLFYDTNYLKLKLNNYSNFRRDLFFKDHLLLRDDLNSLMNMDMNLYDAAIPISSLNLNTSIIRSLLRSQKYFFLGDIVNEDYNTLLSVNGLGEKALQSIKEVVHSYGYQIKNEYDSIYETKERLNDDGFETIDQVYKIDPSLLEILFKNKIYTKEDFIGCGINIFYISGMTDSLRGRLLEFVHKNNIKLNNDMNDEISDNDINKENIRELKNGNEKLKKRIDKKKLLLTRVNALIETKNKLLEEEKKVDAQLKEIVNTILNSNQVGENNHDPRK